MTESLTFSCPSCYTILTVPSSMAGVSGPCPSCGTPIQAPSAVAAPPVPAPLPPAEHRVIEPSTYRRSDVMIAPRDDSEHDHHDPSQPQGTEPPTFSFKVEPRFTRPRNPGGPEVVSRPMPEYNPNEAYDPKLPPPPKNRRSHNVFRLLISALVLAIMAGVAFGLKSYLMPPPAPKNSASEQSSSKRILPEDERSGSAASSPATGGNFEDLTAAPGIVGEANPVIAPEKAPEKPTIAKVALDVLNKFLAAQTLEERLPLIDTQLTPAQLAGTVLAKPFPSSPMVSPEIQETNTAGNFVDLFYNVDFKTSNGQPGAYIVLVRAQGSNPPKVIVDPFLDTFGGRLAKYAANPTDQPATFQVIVTAYARSFDKTVPNHENKLRLRLLPRDNEKEIANAHFGRQSKLGEMLQDDESGFRYGQARTCRVTVQWNTTEDPQMPFLEASDIKDFHWNP